jgi:hypothetical protein
VLLGLLSQAAIAGVHDVTISDVTPRAFSVIWVSDVPVGAATVRVFTSPDGVDEITAGLDITTVSDAYPVAHERGIVKVDVVGLEPSSTYYVLTRTEGLGSPAEIVEYPLASDPPLTVQTAVAVSVSQSTDPSRPIANDLYHQALYDPDGAGAPEGSLMLIRVPGLSPYPVSAFVGDRSPAPVAMADLNNLFAEDGHSVQVPARQPLEIVELRGGVCDASSQLRLRTRRAPEEPDPVTTELLAPDPCFSPDGVSADFDCSGRIGPGDFESFAGHYRSARPACGYHPDYDFNADGRVGLSDFGRFGDVYGLQED